jgi:hypothetical protein
MTGQNPTPKVQGGATWRGLVPDTDPIYDGIWTLSPGRGSNPSSDKKSTGPKPGQEGSKPEQPVRGKAADDREGAG